MESLGAEPGPNLEMIFDASAQGSPVSISDWLPQVLCESRFEMDPFLGGRTFSFSAFCFFCFFLPPGSTSPLDRKATKNAWGKIWQHFFYQPFPDFYICFQRRESESDSLSVASDSLLSHRPAHQAPVSMGFPRQKNWSRLPFSSPGDLPDPGIGPVSPASQADVLPFSIKNPDIITEIQEHM